MTEALAVWGTTSGAGKSLLVTAFARSVARTGAHVVPFKAQNLSTHARVGDGGEMAAAQWLQARAAGLRPDVRMNPVLTKPEPGGRSQVVVTGHVDEELSRRAWRGRASSLWPVIREALDELRRDADLVLVEGAGSPAEVNLADVDLANLATCEHLDARSVLVADIGRGGAFAHLLGTWSLLPLAHRSRLRGFVLNRFHGDPALLAPAPEHLRGLTGVPTLGVLPELRHRLPDEDGTSFRPVVLGGRPLVAVVRYPSASNLDELSAVAEVADVVVATAPADLRGATLVVLPGSKHVTSDAAWLSSTGLAEALVAAAGEGARILGICGGAELLGSGIVDRDGVEGPAGAGARGLGLLPLETELRRTKVVRTTTIRIPEWIGEPWRRLAGRSIDAYEIHHGRAVPGDAVVWCAGSVLGTMAHGLLEDVDIVEAVLDRRPSLLDDTFDLLADALEEHLGGDVVRRLTGLG